MTVRSLTITRGHVPKEEQDELAVATRGTELHSADTVLLPNSRIQLNAEAGNRRRKASKILRRSRLWPIANAADPVVVRNLIHARNATAREQTIGGMVASIVTRRAIFAPSTEPIGRASPS